jgi:hypothetical protein
MLRINIFLLQMFSCTYRSFLFYLLVLPCYFWRWHPQLMNSQQIPCEIRIVWIFQGVEQMSLLRVSHVQFLIMIDIINSMHMTQSYSDGFQLTWDFVFEMIIRSLFILFGQLI